MAFANMYADSTLADAYSKLEFPGTYHLAFRDLPGLLREHVRGTKALDFGCGAGRSTRFLRRHGFDATGIDISREMIRRAQHFDAAGDYRLIEDGDLGQFDDRTFDLVFSAFTFDNIPTLGRKVALFVEFARLLAPAGRIVNLVSSPEIYVHEWASFSTAAFPENRNAVTGDVVRIVNTAIEDARPVEDILWTDEAYRDVFAKARLRVVAAHRPLATDDDGYEWINETRIAPWVIYVLRPQGN